MLRRFSLTLALATALSCSSSSQDAADGGLEGDAGGRDGAPAQCEAPTFVQATVLAEHGPGALGVTIADDITYWANRNEGEIWQVAPPGVPALVAGGQLNPYDVALSNEHIYWTVQTGIARRAIAGGAVESFATGQNGSYGIAIDDVAVYWTNFMGGQVMKLPFSGGTPVVLADGQDGPLDIVLSISAVYWTTGPGLMSVSKDGGSPQKLAGDLATGSGLAIDATHLYWARTGSLVDGTLVPGFVARMSLPDGEPTLLATAESFESPSEVALYGGYLYWVQRNGEVWRAGPDGKCAGKLTENTIGGNGIAVGSQGVFFTTLNNGALSTSPL